MIPLVDLGTDNKTDLAIKKAIVKVLEAKNYILGKRVLSFEGKFAQFIGVNFAVGVASGTDALRLSLRALGIGTGDKVLTVGLTSPFTVIAIAEEGALPVFCDIDEQTLTLDPQDAERKIDKNTRAIIPVHLYGNPCNITTIARLAKKHKLKIIEDACQAHGAMFNGKKVGSLGDIAAFSFYPTKNLGAIGDGGAITTNSLALAKKIRSLRHGGQTRRFWHEYQGINSRLDEIQAAVLEVKLKLLSQGNKKRSLLAQRYQSRLNNLGIKFQETFEGAHSAYHLFVVRVKDREGLRRFLVKRGITSDVYYPYPVYRQPTFKSFSNGKLPITEKVTGEILALPLFPRMTFRKQDKVIDAVKEFYK